MTEATALVLASSSNRTDGKPTPLDFLQGEIVAIPGTHMIIKQVSPHWFRVRFWREIARPESFIKDTEWVADRMYEVVELGRSYQLVDRTSRQK